jgi:hypothetical protein
MVSCNAKYYTVITSAAILKRENSSRVSVQDYIFCFLSASYMQSLEISGTY